MDDNAFIISAPSGDITSTVAGTPAPRMVPGKVGSALRLEGAELNYGKPNECFYNINLCTNGLSISLWVKYYSINTGYKYGPPEGEGVILDGGGFYSNSQGLHLSRNGYLNFQVNIFDDTASHFSNMPYGEVFVWKHLVFTWKGSFFPIILYQNGCLGKGMSFKVPLGGPRSESYDFKIGGNGFGGAVDRGDRALDHVLMWYHSLTQDQVWQLYVQGGQVWGKTWNETYEKITAGVWLYDERILLWDRQSCWMGRNSNINRPRMNVSMPSTCALLALVYPWG